MMLGLGGYKIRHRQISVRQEDEKNSEKHSIAVHYSKNKSIALGKTKRSRLFGLFSILTVCLSTITVVFLVMKSRDNIMSQFITEPKYITASRSFPEYGSAEFALQCNWTMQSMPLEPNCTIWLRPHPRDGEGISHWVTDLVRAFLQAKLVRCNLLVDYGPNVDIHQVLSPIRNLPSRSTSPAMNWTVPSGFVCSRNQRWRRCLQYDHKWSEAASIPQGPFYRFAHHNDERFWLNRSAFKDLERDLPGFRLETGMACSLASLLNLSPRASQFEPELFTRILPALQDKKSLVLAIYIRTGLTDVLAKKEKPTGQNKQERDPSEGFTSFRTVMCGLSLEQQYLQQNTTVGMAYSRVIWMVLTDSEHVKYWITQKYSGQDVYVNVSASREQEISPRVVKREVLTTASRGIHTRTVRSPSTADFAEAIIDWYLIGESDVVIANGPTFGATAALRTARPYYDMYKCRREKIPKIH